MVISDFINDYRGHYVNGMGMCEMDRELELKIQEVIKDRVAPVLIAHGGNLEIVDFEDGVISVRFLGQCAGCPSAMLTIEEVVEKELVDAVPEIKSVELIQQTSQELLDFAKQLLKK